MSVMPALTVSLVFPLLFALFIHRLDLYGTGKSRETIHAVAWGMIVSTFTVAVQSAVVMDGWITEVQLKQTVAPVLEELLKAGILLYLVSRANFNYVVDGAIYGFGAGIGFAIIENIAYILSYPETALGLAAARVLSASLIHACASGLVGSTLGAGRIEHGARRLGFVLTGFILAITIHATYNNLVAMGISLAEAATAGMIGLALIILIIEVSLVMEQRWIVEKLGMTDRVTAGEAAIVHRIENMDEVLAPIARRFGPDKAALTESLLYLQAEIGIKRKLIEMAADTEQRRLIQEEAKRRIDEMDVVRRRIGTYCMLFIRSVYLAGGTQLWALIDQRVREAGAREAGGGLWSKLDERIKSSRSRDEDP